MTCRCFHIFATTAAVVLLCGAIAQSASGDGTSQLTKNKKFRVAAKQAGSFVLSGEFSGKLENIIDVGNKKVFITKRTVINRVGVGSMQRGTNVSNVFLFVAGKKIKGTPTASLIIVRSNNGSGEQSMNMLSKAAKHRIPSDSDPKVGKLEDKTPR